MSTYETIYDKNKDYYSILGVHPLATEDEIKRAYREAAKKCHPDLNNTGNQEYDIKLVNEAYDILSRKETRFKYDRERKAALSFKGKISGTFNKVMNSQTTINSQAYDDYMAFLDEMEPSFNFYGVTLDNFREGVSGKRGKIPKNTIEEYKKTIKRELEFVKRRAKAFDAFQVFYQSVITEAKTLHAKTLKLLPKYTDPSYRVKIDPIEFEKKKKQLLDALETLRLIREKALNNLEQKSALNNINYEDLLRARGLNEREVSITEINELLTILSLLEQLAYNIKPTGMSLSSYLYQNNINILKVTEEELITILQKQNNIELPNLDELDQLLREGDHKRGK